MLRLFLECALRPALIAAGTAAVLEILRVKTARARHAAWAGVVMWMLVLPAWTVWGPKAPLRVLPAQASTAANRNVPGTSPLPTQSPAVEVHVDGRAVSSPSFPWRTCLGFVYLAGVAVLLGRLANGTIRAHRLTSRNCVAPVTVGWLHPTVILPECWQEWSPAQLAAVMAHEREHARRRDPLVQWMALLNRAVFWFHPLAWYLEKHLSRLAEEACDAAVLAQGHDPYEYSRSLLDIAQSVVRSGARVHVWGMAMPGSGLTRRVRQILEGRPAPRLSRARMAFAAIGCAVLSTAFVATAVARRTPPPPIAQAAAPRTETPPPQSQTPPARPAPRPPVRTAATPDQTPADQRMLVLFFDLGEMTEADLARSVAAAQRIGLSQLRSQDLMAVMTYSGGGTLKVMQDFTNNRDRLIETLQQVTGASLKDGEVATAGRRSAALSEAIQKLGVVKEKKALIFFTSGASNGQATSEEAKALSDAAVSAKVAIYAIDVRGFPAQ